MWFSWAMLVSGRVLDCNNPLEGSLLTNYIVIFRWIMLIFLGCTLPETNIFAPENGWLEYDRFLLGPGLFSGAFAVSFRAPATFLRTVPYLGYGPLPGCQWPPGFCHIFNRESRPKPLFATVLMGGSHTWPISIYLSYQLTALFLNRWCSVVFPLGVGYGWWIMLTHWLG